MPEMREERGVTGEFKGVNNDFTEIIADDNATVLGSTLSPVTMP
jgi:hypothetical protein